MTRIDGAIMTSIDGSCVSYCLSKSIRLFSIALTSSCCGFKMATFLVVVIAFLYISEDSQAVLTFKNLCCFGFLFHLYSIFLNEEEIDIKPQYGYHWPRVASLKFKMAARCDADMWHFVIYSRERCRNRCVLVIWSFCVITQMVCHYMGLSASSPRCILYIILSFLSSGLAQIRKMKNPQGDPVWRQAIFSRIIQNLETFPQQKFSFNKIRTKRGQGLAKLDKLENIYISAKLEKMIYVSQVENMVISAKLEIYLCQPRLEMTMSAKLERWLCQQSWKDIYVS